MIPYLLQVSCCWIVFYGIYYVLLRKETFFSFNRLFLTGTLILSLFIPQIGTIIKNFVVEQPQDLGIILYQFSETPYIISDALTEPNEIAWRSILLVGLALIYTLGVIMKGLKFVVGLQRIYHLYKGGDKIKAQNYTLIETNNAHLPFSFFHYVFLSKELPISKNIEEIIRHELTHVREWHSVDILLVEVLNIFFWFNPILRLYKKALQETHEYFADASVLKQSTIKNYGQILLGQSSSGIEVALANHFFNSQIKKRINMMYQKKSGRAAKLKYLAAIPVLAFALLLFSSSVTKKDELSTIEPFPMVDTIPDSRATLKEVFTVVEEMPYLKNCNEGTIEERLACSNPKLIQYLFRNIKYPKEARKAGIEGTVIVQFTIDKNGDVVNPKIARDIGGGCGKDALRVIKEMAETLEWNPGKQRGSAVNVLYNLPIQYRLEGDLPKPSNNNDDYKEGANDLSKIIVTGYKTPPPPPPSDQPIEIFEEIQKGLGIKNHSDAHDIIIEPLANAKEKPLIVIDGKVMGKHYDLKKVDANQIESVNVLKSKAAIDKYGVKGKDGVVEFNLKKMDEIIEEIQEGVGTKNLSNAQELIIESPGNKKENPLIVLDGKIMDSNYNLEKLDANQIETINVLKGEAAKKKYGDKSENGVVEISLKSLDNIFSKVKEMPRFPGCESMDASIEEIEQCSKEKLLGFIYQNLKYPKAAQEAGIQGMTVVQFVINTDGKIIKPKVIRDIGGGTQEAVLEVVDKMNSMEENWRPGYMNDSPVKVLYTLPVRFKLEDNDCKGCKEENITTREAKPMVVDFMETFSIFPNPAQENITLKLKGKAKPITLSVNSIDGKQVYRQMIQDFTGETEISINVKDFPRGNLIMNVYQDGKSQSKQFVLK